MFKDKIALIAGDGTLPVILAGRLAKNYALSLLIVLQGSIERFAGIPVRIYEIAPGRVKKLMNVLAKNGINKIIFIGKIDKGGFIERKGLDLKTIKLIKKLKDGKDMSIFNVIVNEFKKIGIEILPQDEFLKDMIAGKGVLTKRKPSKAEIKDADFGIDHAKKLATMDIGQTVIVKNQIITAVEAAEGTNAAIRRGASISEKNFIICKAARANQDRRFDIPGVGMDTLEIMTETGCKLLAIEAGKILIVDIENVLNYANKNKISIIGI
jgi:hypothetical protein